MKYSIEALGSASAKVVIKLQWQNRNELLVPIRALQWYRFADIINKRNKRWKMRFLPALADFSR